MSAPSEATQHALAEAIDATVALITKAHAEHGGENTIDNFALNALVNALAKFVLISAAAECVASVHSSNENAVRIVAAIKAAQIVGILPDVLVKYFDANAATAARNANLIHEAEVARERGSVQ